MFSNGKGRFADLSIQPEARPIKPVPVKLVAVKSLVVKSVVKSVVSIKRVIFFSNSLVLLA